MADAFIQVLVENANSLLQKEIGLLSGVEKDVESLSSKLSTIRNFLEDAEEKHFTDKAVDGWLRKLKNVAYDVDDVLDEYKTEVERLEYKRSSTNKVCASLTKLNPKIPTFRHKIGSQLKQLQQKLAGIIQEGHDFKLQERIVNRPQAVGVIRGRETGYLVNENEVHGREEDRDKIVKCLLNNAAGFEDLLVYPIVGMGGLGKTTLARLIFNDHRIKSHFETHIWVCVPEKSSQNDFEVKSVISAMIEFLSGKRSEVSDLASLQKRLQELLAGKRYLLVLDDVWYDKEDRCKFAWDELKCVLSCGSKGAAAIVTTRLEPAAKIMGTFPPHNLSVLSDDDCFLFFKQQALQTDDQNIMSIAQEIAQKCKGVPLVAKTLGGSLGSTRPKSDWEKVRDSELWRLSDDENSILPILRLSYWNLPSDAKRCFAFCAVFPKDFIMRTDLLIHLWMANGFISSTEGLDVEDAGNQMCRQLAYSSLIQDLQVDGLNNIQSFKMHDLVHDLAQSIMKKECCYAEEGRETTVETTTRHFSLCYYWDSPYKAKSLRTLLFQARFYDGWADFPIDFSKLQKVRALVVPGYTERMLPPSLGNLKHLRHLDLSQSEDLEVLPNAICELWNLQSLDLTSCSSLRRLPDQTRRLRNLWYLCLKDCYRLKSTPPRLGEIIGLKTLSLFVVDEKKGCCLSELGNLNLKGELHIKHLERVKNPVDAKKANLGFKGRLRVLVLSWNTLFIESSKDLQVKSSKDLQVLEVLQPHPNIEELTIGDYSGARLPRWMGDKVYGKLVSIKLVFFLNHLNLALLGKLPALKRLQIYDSPFINYIYDESEIQKEEEGAFLFLSLEELTIEGLDSLERLSIQEGKEIFPCLTRLRISDCPELTLPMLASVTELKVIGYSSNVFLNSISNLTNLKSLSIRDDNKSTQLLDTTFQKLTSLKTLEIFQCQKLQSLPEGLHDLKSLECLEIEYCDNLKCLPNGLYHLTALQSLTIKRCPELTDFPHGFQHLISLKELHFDGYWSSGEGSKLVALPEALQHVPNLEALDISHFLNLTLLPEWIGNLTSLQTLELYSCIKLNSLPTSIQNLTKLQKLDIYCCGEELMKRCEKEIGEDWQKIAHIPDVRITNPLDSDSE